ncbi:V-set and immunoglobulin domain-containing protein 8a [Genypterus blacodes]|uniref:V-set and immunoglobulin domain-containing protein 8a n=1 Tax=Genypterus blacodes TaxID=154954 RepID=UPI003F773710
MSKQTAGRCRRLSSLGRPLWFSAFVFSLLSSEIGRAGGLEVISTGPQTVKGARGQSAVLGCNYTPGPSDTGEIDIEWLVVSPDTTQKDQLLLSYSGGKKFVHDSHALAKGLDFAAGDPSRGDASLSIPVLLPAHRATYQCKVKKAPGVDMRKVSLVVLVKPSVPRCRVEGGAMVGEAVALHCESAEGSTPLKYSWRRESAGPLPASAATQDSASGTLVISNHSQSFAGLYLCEVNNAVGTERCKINLQANKPPNRAALIVGTVVGSLLFVIIVLILIWLLVWKCRERPRYDKEFSNEIREDAPPPESRPTSRVTSRSTARHPDVTYYQGNSPGQNFYGEQVAGRPSDNSNAYAPVTYDSKYGYIV